jgi:hypothetical protein
MSALLRRAFSVYQSVFAESLGVHVQFDDCYGNFVGGKSISANSLEFSGPGNEIKSHVEARREDGPFMSNAGSAFFINLRSSEVDDPFQFLPIRLV